jgi:1,4-alpha-glucan branching enzyme
VLHAHLPYIRHSDHEYFLEENWLYESITETYIPLLDLLSHLIDDGVDFRITISLSPTLLEMFNDPLLRERYERHIQGLIELSEREVKRTKGDIRFAAVAGMYHRRFKRAYSLFHGLFKKDLVSAFRALQETGKVRILTSAATHAFLPNIAAYPSAVKAQLKVGSLQYKKNFGSFPEGIWLPECGYVPGFDRYIAEEGITYFFLDAHGIEQGMPLPKHGVYSPVRCPSGALAFGRDTETSHQVWSSIAGYPGDFNYREFYRDVGFDLDHDYVKEYLKPFGAKTFTGLKYFRITGKTSRKKPYNISRARKKAAEHAAHFILQREKQICFLSDSLKIRPVITAIYDAELFGHWWFEGTGWIEFLLRGIYAERRNFRTMTPSEYVSEHHCGGAGLQTSEPSMSSWGERGYSDVWLNDSNDYVCRHIMKATERMICLADTFPDAEGLLQRALNQAAREIMLLQHSDWTFILNAGTATGYAIKRIEDHICRFTYLYQSALSGRIAEHRLQEIEDKDRIFQDIDYRVYRSRLREKSVERI